MVITTLTHNNATWTHTDTGHSPWQLLFKQFSSSQINVSQNMFARSQLGTFYRVYTLPGPNTGQVGAGYWVAAEPRWRCCKSSWISPFTLQQELLCLTGDQRGTCNNFENQVIVAILFYGADSFYFIYLLHPTILDFAVIELSSVSAREHSFK